MTDEHDEEIPEPPEGEFVGDKPFEDLSDEELDAADKADGAGEYLEDDD